jgi:hypothetical protein
MLSNEHPVLPKGEMVTKGHLKCIEFQPQTKPEIKYILTG